MKTYLINIADANSTKVLDVLKTLVDQNLIELKEYNAPAMNASDDQIDEMIDESELGPYYTEEEARRILKI